MGRTVAIVWHASFSVVAAVLYFLFILPRWWELTGITPHTLGTALRIVVAVLIALAALPVVFTLLRTRRPEFGTPQLALTLRIWSIVAHLLAGLLIAGTAISEIWLSLDDAGQWLFGIYGAAAAVALLGVAGFYLSFVAELPPPPPKPLKPAKPKQRRRDRKKDKDAEESDTSEETPENEDEVAAADEDAEPAAEAEAEEVSAEPEDVPAAEETLVTEESKKTTSRWGLKSKSKRDTEVKPAQTEPVGGLKNRRPSGKGNRRNPTGSPSTANGK